MNEEAVLDVTVNAARAYREFSTITGFTEKEAKRAADSWAKAQATAAVKARLVTVDETKKTASAIKKLAMGAGFGGLAGDVEDLSEGFSNLSQNGKVAAGVLGAAGLTTVAIAAAASAAAIAYMEFGKALAATYRDAEKLAETAERFSQFEAFEPVNQESADATIRMQYSLEAIDVLYNQIWNLVAQRYAPQLEEIVLTTIQIGLEAAKLYRIYSDSQQMLEKMTQSWLPADEIKKNTTEAEALVMVTRAHTQVNETNKTVEERRRKIIADMAEAERKHNEQVRETEKAEREAEKAAREWADRQREIAAATKAIMDVISGAQSDQETRAQRINREYEDRLRIIDEEFAKTDKGSKAIGQAEAARAAATQRMIRDEAKLRQTMMLETANRELERADWNEREFKKRQEQAAEEARWAAEFHASQVQRQQERIQQIQDGLSSTLDFASNIGAGLLALQEIQNQKRSDSIDALREKEAAALASGDKASAASIRAKINGEAAAIKKSFERTKNLQRVAAIVDAARAAVSLIPAYAALGPGAPAAALATAGVGLAVSIATIEAQQPPKLHTGGRVRDTGMQPDEVGVTARVGEHMVNERGAQHYRRELEELNRTGQWPGSGGPSVSAIVLDGRVVGMLGSKLVEQPATRRAIAQASQQPMRWWE